MQPTAPARAVPPSDPTASRWTRLRRAAITALAVALAGCGESNRAAIEALRPAYQARRATLANLAAALPPPGTAATTLSPLAPPVILREASEDTSNTEVVMAAQLIDPEGAPPQSLSLDLGMSGALARCLAWTGPRNPMSASALGRRDGARLRRECGAALERPYLLVLRVARYVAPVAHDATSFAPGAATIEGFVLDAPSGALRGSFVVSAATDANVQFSYQRGGTREIVRRRYSRYGTTETRTTETIRAQDPAERLRAAAHSSLWTNARQAVAQALRASGATIELE